MIDIHSHILPMIDDGASSVEMALDMLDAAYRDGTDAIILTPHLAYEYGFINPYSKIKNLFKDLKNIVEYEHIPIDLYLGCEFLFSSPETFYNHKKDITTLNDTQYLLMEFFFDVSKEEVIEAVDIIIDNHMIPIIAHPERFECFQTSSSLADEVIRKGALLQMNKGSVLGRYGRTAKETVLELLDKHYISFVGSDAHHPQKRSSLMYEAYEYMKEYYDKEYVKDIFFNNPKNMLKDIDIREER